MDGVPDAAIPDRLGLGSDGAILMSVSDQSECRIFMSLFGVPSRFPLAGNLDGGDQERSKLLQL